MLSELALTKRGKHWSSLRFVLRLKLADIDQIDKYSPVIELGEHR